MYYKNKINIYQAIILFIVAFVLITITFLWNENNYFSVEKLIDHEKVAGYFTSIGSLATALTLVFVSLQLKESIYARRLLNSPDLYPEPATFQVRQVKSTCFPDSIEPKEGAIFGLKGSSIPAYIQIKNISDAIAKNDRISWEYEDKKYISENGIYIIGNELF